MSQTVVSESTARDFDFWMGRWHGRNRVLRERLAGCEEWEEFESLSIARSILGGTANEDVFLTDRGGGYIGMSFRFFDPEPKLWSIYWADSRSPARSIRPSWARSTATSASSKGLTRSRVARSSCATRGRA